AALARVKEAFGVSTVRVWGKPPELVEQVAVAGGSGGDLIGEARLLGAQLLVTGEVRHHQAVPGFLEDFAVAEVGHFASEAVFMPGWARQLARLFDDKDLAVQVLAAAAGQAPFACL
ncbi:MAG: Nif3-like dinuclear metal center hexameric protein, partial [Deltaproteobacteria bacterium]|nr:Nif3-like dinuclear metal center hexameric protein [Deltaproteobacteria bacterium]